MNLASHVERLKGDGRYPQTLLGLASLGLFLLGIGVISTLILSRTDREGIQVIDKELSKETSQQDVESIVVDVQGAVEKPGVLRLGSNARVSDALAAAGGLSATADRNRIARDLNLAQKVQDGAKLYVPMKGESVQNTKSTNELSQKASASDNSEVSTLAQTIHINTASKEELDSLWGIGPSRAQAIIDGRPYSKVEDLLERKIVPKNVYDRNVSKISL